MEHEHHEMVSAENNATEYIKFALVIAGIIFVAWFMSLGGGTYEFLRWFMGVFFLVFATFKFIGYKMFVVMFSQYDVIAKRFKTYAYAYPFIELALGLIYIMGLFDGLRDLMTLVVMGVSSIGVFQEIYHRRSGVYCACLGNVIKLPLSTVSLVEDVGMGAMALFMLTMG